MLGRWALVTIVLAGVLCTGGCSGDKGSAEISVLDVRATAGTDGVVQVTKLVTYRARGSGRTTLHDWIPLRANIGFLRNRYRTIRNVRVTTTEETPLPARIIRKPNGVDVAVPVARTGVRTFAISYELRNAFTVTDDGITFDHDLVGSDWRVRARLTRIRLQVPGLVGASCTVWAPADSKSRPCDDVRVSERGRPDAVVAVRQDTPRTDVMRLELRLREGAMVAEPPVPGTPFWADRPVTAALLAAGPIAVALLIAGLALDRRRCNRRRRNRGRRRPGGPSAGGGPAPPCGVRPGQSGFITAAEMGGRQVRSRHVAATLIDLSRRGHLRIDAVDRADGRDRTRSRWTLTARSATNDPAPNKDVPAPYEAALLRELFRDREVIAVDSTMPPVLALAGLIERPGGPRLRWGHLAARALLYVLAGSVLGSFGILCWSIWTYLQLPMEQAEPFAAPLAGLLMTPFGLVFGLGLREEIEVWRDVRRARRMEVYRRFLVEAPAETAGETADAMERHLPYAIALDVAARWVEPIGTPGHPVRWFTGGTREPGRSGVQAFTADLVAALNGGRRHAPW